MPDDKQNHRPLIIAHRGSSAIAPENTMAAFKQAIKDGADGIEFDVRLAHDGVPVVIHDATLQRTAGFSGRVSRYSSHDLNKIDVGSWFNQKHPSKARKEFSAETVPTLSGLLDLMRDNKGLIYLEIKCSKNTCDPLVKAVAEMIGRSDLLPRIIVKSFHLDALVKFRRIMPEARIAVLFAPKFMHLIKPRNRLVTKALELQANEISLHYSLATPNAVREAADYGFPVTIWTADHTAWVKRAENLGIHAIVTNNPARLLARKNELSKARAQHV
jgi:glycerophosphoryl diester phosphodiesterase